MAQFDYLDGVKNSLLEQFQPETARANPTLPPDLGQMAPAPDISMPQPQGLDSFAPEQAPQGDMGMPPPQNAPMPGGDVPPLGGITLQDLLGMGLNALLVGLLTQQPPGEGGTDATTGQPPL